MVHPASTCLSASLPEAIFESTNLLLFIFLYFDAELLFFIYLFFLIKAVEFLDGNFLFKEKPPAYAAKIISGMQFIWLIEHNKREYVMWCWQLTNWQNKTKTPKCTFKTVKIKTPQAGSGLQHYNLWPHTDCHSTYITNPTDIHCTHIHAHKYCLQYCLT